MMKEVYRPNSSKASGHFGINPLTASTHSKYRLLKEKLCKIKKKWLLLTNIQRVNEKQWQLFRYILFTVRHVWASVCLCFTILFLLFFSVIFHHPYNLIWARLHNTAYTYCFTHSISPRSPNFILSVSFFIISARIIIIIVSIIIYFDVVFYTVCTVALPLDQRSLGSHSRSHPYGFTYEIE